ncbi:type II secretion system F family protein [Serratia symbiotica]|uniref:type II secretion system F family protein n=1 Tax=Serratia symbiotica TaxID=138074 RepID=UPI0013277CB2|nr:type II secretion system F family protein [Serratia symbiotica]MBF1994354.1 type II secretion system F family protein [Serratia symbiotica]MBQ0954820.1 type II secretion system F family protein [Serratia symbiotica]QTP14273.1 type II secretion system F family protein [Serratia symbiotica]
MKCFEVTLLLNGTRSTQQIQASCMEEARTQVECSGALVLKIKPCRRLTRRTKPFPLTLFIQELIALLDAGLVIVEAIEALSESSRDAEQQRVLGVLMQSLHRGRQLSQALAEQPALFPPLLISTVASSEQTGQLAIALGRFLHYEKRMETLRKRIRSTLLYPSVVLSVGCLILFFLLGFIIPRFAIVFEGMKNLNGSAQFIVWWGHLTQNHGTLLLVSSIAGAILLVSALRDKSLRQMLLNQLLRIPQLQHQYELAILVRFYRTLGLLLQGGMTVVTALTLTGSLLPPRYHQNLNQVLTEVQAGKALSSSLESQQLTTPVASRLLVVGERSGDQPAMCERIAAFYDESLERAIETFSKVFEPVLMLIVGGLVGLVVFLLYMPIFEIAGGLS